MIAKKEQDQFVVYDDSNSIIGSIKLLSKNFDTSEINCDNKTYQIIRTGWKFEVKENNETICHLKTNSFFGDITVMELHKKIKGVFSLKWGTQMVDENNKTLLKIGNDSLLFDKGVYEIEVADSSVTNFEILLSLFGHFYGSQLKTLSVLLNS